MNRAPPQAAHAERAVLAAIIFDHQLYDAVADIITDEDFYQDRHRRIWQAMTSLRRRGAGIDLTTVLEECGQMARESMDLEQHLLDLSSALPETAHVRDHARAIRDAARLRDLIRTCQEVTAGAFELEGNPDDFFTEAEGKVLKACERRSEAQDTQHIAVPAGDVFNRLVQASESGESITGLQTGFYGIDRMTTGLQDGDLVLLAARPSMGKTALAINVALNVAESTGPVLVFSLEMTSEQLATRSLSSLSAVDSTAIRTGGVEQEDWQRIVSSMGELTRLPIYVNQTPGITAPALRAQARRKKAQVADLRLVIVDYLQLMRSGLRLQSREQEVAEISRSLKALAKELSCPVLALSQLNRSVETRPPDRRRPQLADLRESGALEQDADVVMFIYRDEVYNEDSEDRGIAEVIISKQRQGPLGAVRLRFDTAFTRFDNLAEQEVEFV